MLSDIRACGISRYRPWVYANAPKKTENPKKTCRERMRSKRMEISRKRDSALTVPRYRQYLDNAESCEQRAAAAQDRDAKATFTLAANCWRELARYHVQPAFEFQTEAS
jgi:hypothetical protein